MGWNRAPRVDRCKHGLFVRLEADEGTVLRASWRREAVVLAATGSSGALARPPERHSARSTAAT